ncbi:hypothetical protein Srubr_31080 [Streptomyces rubradiris]|uniref:Peptidase S1 domain-containing protein n=2 Tax=Streptomyces rubradiris TaxID=285531 RepID=A0ABQ3RBM8_STRRR|nr:S1 family peptidase [Streptomyces rubradiris]GHG92116.1 hypothetical protein GCM10018792_00010 [Streptomyces rubradiris]GHI53262.1 hypothetical protein Srubr_31080 [Streptomyces rubradiris]
MPKPRARVTLTIGFMAATLAVGCLTTTASAATGDAASGSLAFTARLQIGDNLRACSGVLIAPQWLATSANCFTDDPGTGQVATGKPKWKTLATIGRTDLTTTGGQVREVVELVPRNDRDMVMARLVSPTTGIVPVPLATTAPTVGEELTIAGFGRSKSDWVPNQLHTAVLTVESVTGTTLALDGKTEADSICADDSGGPVLRQKNGRYELVALGSRSWQGGCWGADPAETRNNALSPRLDNITGGNTLTAGTVLTAGDSLTSNATRLTLQDDGNSRPDANSRACDSALGRPAGWRFRRLAGRRRPCDSRPWAAAVTTSPQSAAPVGVLSSRCV